MTVLLQGWLQKKKREEKKALLGTNLGSKYQKRWFELTPDHLAYSKVAEDIQLRNNVEVFQLDAMEYVKRQKVKLEMRFPMRLLRLKAETPEDAEMWEAALKKANMMKVHGDPPALAGAKSAPVVSSARSQFTHLTIEADSDDDLDSPQAAPAKKPQQPMTRQPLASTRSEEHPAPARAGMTRPTPLVPPSMRVEQQEQLAQQSKKPPSPRSLLANPKMGSTMVTSEQAADAAYALPNPTPKLRNPVLEDAPLPVHHDDSPSLKEMMSMHKQQQQRAGGYRAEVDETPAACGRDHRAEGGDEAERRQQQQQRRHAQKDAERLTLEPQQVQAVKQEGMGRSGSTRGRQAERLVLEEGGPVRGVSVGNSPARGAERTSNGRMSGGRDEHGEALILAPSAGKPPLSPAVRSGAGAPGGAHSHGPSPMGPAGRQGSRAGSAAGSVASSARESRASAATSGTGDDHWLASDWDSSDEEQERSQQHRRPHSKLGSTDGRVPDVAPSRGRGSVAAPAPAVIHAGVESPVHGKGHHDRGDLDDDKWDSDDDDDESATAGKGLAAAKVASTAVVPSQHHGEDGDEQWAREESAGHAAAASQAASKQKFRRAAAAASPAATSAQPAAVAKKPASAAAYKDEGGRLPQGHDAGVQMDSNFVEEDWDDDE